MGKGQDAHPAGGILGAFWVEARLRYGAGRVRFLPATDGPTQRPERVVVTPGRGFNEQFIMDVPDERQLRVECRLGHPVLIPVEFFELSIPTETGRAWRLIGPPARRGLPREFPAGTQEELIRYYGRRRVIPVSASTPLGQLEGLRLMVWPGDADPRRTRGMTQADVLPGRTMRVRRYGPFEEAQISPSCSDLLARMKAFIGPGSGDP